MLICRPGFPKVVIVLTDGVQTQEPGAVRLDEAAAPIHEQRARVFVVGTGSKISMNKLQMIAKDPANIFTVMSFENLETVTRDLAASACLPGTTTFNHSFIYLCCSCLCLLGIFVIAKLDIVFVCFLVSDYEFLDIAKFYEVR